MSKTLTQSNVLLCGSSRVGKTTLINAICQKKLAKSDGRLSSCTKQIDRYSFENSVGDLTHETIFWDTPGIESWNENDVINYMNSLIKKSQPICMIYCVSPGSFVLLNHLSSIISKCHEENIFCALVCTNMWAGLNRQIIIKELCEILNKIYPNIQSKEEDGIIYYDHVALVTMVNSQEYIDEDFGIRKPPSGIDELIFGIGKCLQRDFMFAWLKTVSHNKSFWTKMSSKLNDILQIPYETFNNICQRADNFLEYIFSFTDDYPQYYTPTIVSSPTTITSTDDQTEEFHDVELSEISIENLHKNKLKFVVKTKETAASLSDILIKLGAKQLNVNKSKTEDEQKIIITTKFDNVEYLKAIYDLCQTIIQEDVTCTIVD